MTDQIGLSGYNRRTRAEIGATGLPIFAGYLSIDPNQHLRGVQAVQIYRTMRDDEPAASALWFAAQQMLRTDLYVEPGGKTKADKLAAKFLEECLLDMREEAAVYLRQMYGFIWAGWHVSELCYKRRSGGKRSRYDDGRVGWSQWALRRQDSLYRWGYDQVNGRFLYFSQRPAPTYTLRVIPWNKIIHIVGDDSEASPEGRSAYRPMYRQWFFVKNFEWMHGVALERFGTGLPVFEINSTVALTQENKQIIEDTAASIRQNQNAYVLLPEGIRFRFEPSPGVDSESYLDTIQKMRTWMLTTALAEFIALGNSGGGAYSLGKDKSELFLLALNGFQDRVLSALNQQAVKRLFAYNDFGNLTDLPRLALPAVKRYDTEALAKFASMLDAVGGLHLTARDEEWFRKVSDMPEVPIKELEELHAADDAQPIQPTTPPQNDDQSAGGATVATGSEEGDVATADDPATDEEDVTVGEEDGE